MRFKVMKFNCSETSCQDDDTYCHYLTQGGKCSFYEVVLKRGMPFCGALRCQECLEDKLMYTTLELFSSYVILRRELNWPTSSYVISDPLKKEKVVEELHCCCDCVFDNGGVTCKSKKAPIHNFVEGVSYCDQLNNDGKCAFFEAEGNGEPDND